MGRLTHLVPWAGPALPKDTAAPVVWLHRVEGNRIALAVSLVHLAALPAHGPGHRDEATAAAVEARLAELPSAGEAPTTSLVNGWRRHAAGDSPREADRVAAVVSARRIPGVWEVRDLLVAEEPGDGARLARPAGEGASQSPPSERADRLLRPRPGRPSHWEVERAAQMLNLTP